MDTYEFDGYGLRVQQICAYIRRPQIQSAYFLDAGEGHVALRDMALPGRREKAHAHTHLQR